MKKIIVPVLILFSFNLFSQNNVKNIHPQGNNPHPYNTTPSMYSSNLRTHNEPRVNSYPLRNPSRYYRYLTPTI